MTTEKITCKVCSSDKNMFCHIYILTGHLCTFVHTCLFIFILRYTICMHCNIFLGKKQTKTKKSRKKPGTLETKVKNKFPGKLWGHQDFREHFHKNRNSPSKLGKLDSIDWQVKGLQLRDASQHPVHCKLRKCCNKVRGQPCCNQGLIMGHLGCLQKSGNRYCTASVAFHLRRSQCIFNLSLHKSLSEKLFKILLLQKKKKPWRAYKLMKHTGFQDKKNPL